MTLTLMSLLCASKSGSILRNASLRLLAAAIVTVSGAACTGGAVQTIATKSRLALEREPVRCASAASHCEVGVVDDQSIIVGAIEAIVDGGAELFGQIVFLFRGRIQYPVPNSKLELPGNDVLADLHIPAPGLAEIHRGAHGQ